MNMGTIQAADNEAQLAGVLAHEISHVVQRHATRAASKQLMAQAPLSILGGLLGSSMGAQLARYGISFGAGSYFLRNSRKAESEADLVGTDIMYDTGYDPRQMAVFFEKLQAQGGSRAPQFLSDHPNPGNRASAVMDEVATLPRKSSYRQDSAEFRQIKQMVMGRGSGSSQSENRQRLQPAAATDVEPGGNAREFEGQGLRLRYPGNWKASESASGTVFSPEAGSQVHYGAILNRFRPQNSATLEESTRELIAALKQSNPALREVGRIEDIRVNGVAGKSIDLLQGGQRQWLVTMSRGGREVDYLMFVAPQDDFDRVRPVFEEMVRSWHRSD